MSTFNDMTEWFTDTGIHMTQKGKNQAYDPACHEGIQFLKMSNNYAYDQARKTV